MQKKNFSTIHGKDGHRFVNNFQYVGHPHGWERRKNRRYPVEERTLAIFKNCAGAVLDISITGLAFQVAHFSEKSSWGRGRFSSSNIEKIDIWSSELHKYILKDLPVFPVFNRATGRLYPDQGNILTCRGGLKFMSPMTTAQLSRIRNQLLYFASNS